jgi:GntR family transcriptional regulator
MVVAMERQLLQAKAPLYHAVKETLRQQVVEKYQPGDRIPPEADLTAMFGVSQITVRRAIQDLVREGLLYRRQGKGTFVSGPKLVQNLTILNSFIQMVVEQKRTIRSETISISELEPSETANYSELSPPVLEVVRKRIVDDEPFAINSSYYSTNAFPEMRQLLEKDPNLSIYRLLQERYDVEVSVQEQTLEITFADDWEAALLDIEPGSPAFLFNIKTQNQRRKVIEYVRAVYRSDRCKFTMFPKRP